MATAWSAVSCMEMSFQESPTLQVSMRSPRQGPSAARRSTSAVRPAPLEEPAGTMSRKFWLWKPTAVSPQRRATSACMCAMSTGSAMRSGTPTTVRPARSTREALENRVSRAVSEPIES